MWRPVVHQCFDVPPRGTIFIVVCEEAFARQEGQVVRIDDKDWKILSWDDRRQANGPWNGENIALLCREVVLQRRRPRFGRGLRA